MTFNLVAACHMFSSMINTMLTPSVSAVNQVALLLVHIASAIFCALLELRACPSVDLHSFSLVFALRRRLLSGLNSSWFTLMTLV